MSNETLKVVESMFEAWETLDMEAVIDLCKKMAIYGA
jgi:hypothetical protein